MKEKTKIGLEILQTALLLGILGDVLLRSDEPGLNVLLVLGAVTAAVVMLFMRHRRERAYDVRLWALHGALVFFAAMFAWRDSEELRVWDVLAIFGIGAVLILPTLRIKVHLAGFSHYILGIFVSGINVFFAPFFLMMADIKWASASRNGWSRHLVSVLRGLLIAAPLLLIFGGLFVAADAVFEGVVNRTFNIVPDVIISHIFLTIFFTWVTAGYLRGFLFEIFALETVDMGMNVPSAVASVTEPVEEKAEVEPTAEKEEEKPKQRNWQDFDNTVLPRVLTLGGVETAIVLGLIDLLFLSFVIIQVPYLFGGMDLVQNTPDFKLAEFARRGFGELVAVSALVLPILLVSHWLLRKDQPVNEKIFRVLAGIQIVLLFVIMASAAQRLLLLTGPVGYGLTTTRFYPMAFMIWLAVVFCWFAVTVLRGARQHFAWGMIWSALFILGTLHFVNPDAFIVRTNLKLMQQGRPFDARYNAHLSADAVPTLIEGLPAMSPEQQTEVKSILSTKMSVVCTGDDFRSWAWSRSVARSLIHEHTGPTQSGTCSGL